MTNIWILTPCLYWISQLEHNDLRERDRERERERERDRETERHRERERQRERQREIYKVNMVS